MNKRFISAGAVILAAALIFPQDFDDFSDFGDFGSFGDEETAGAQGGFGNFSAASSLSIGGEAGADARAWIDTDDGYDSANDIADRTSMENDAYLKLEFGYSGSASDVEAKLKFDQKTIRETPEDILEEATVRGYFGNLTVEGGKMKVVWGKGDKLHVLDNFNANNYTDCIFPEYIDRRLAEPMLRATYSIPNDYNIRIEGVYMPLMTADRFAESGKLVPYSAAAIKKAAESGAAKAFEQYVSNLEAARLTINSVFSNQNSTTEQKASAQAALQQANTSYTLALNNVSSLSSDSALLYPDTQKLRYGQAGIRLTGTVHGIDWGTSYYYGHYKQPSFNAAKLTPCIQKYIASGSIDDGDSFLQYDQLQVFGLEAAAVIWKLNTRWEFAYNMTEDYDGTDSAVHNNSIAWVGGFDIDIPVHNINVNIQETGTYILKNGEIKAGDVDYNSDGNYSRNKLVVNVSDTFLHEKLKAECTVIYGIENKEWCVQPKIEYNILDGLTFKAAGAYLYSDNENGEFYNFTYANEQNHSAAYAQLSLKYSF